jgi:hypothetical protein
MHVNDRCVTGRAYSEQIIERGDKMHAGGHLVVGSGIVVLFLGLLTILFGKRLQEVGGKVMP